MATHKGIKFHIRKTPVGIGPPGTNKRGPKGGKDYHTERPTIYPFDTLEVGQSFLAPKALRNKLAPLAVYHGKKLGRQFAVVQLTYDKKKIAVCRTK